MTTHGTFVGEILVQSAFHPRSIRVPPRSIRVPFVCHGRPSVFHLRPIPPKPPRSRSAPERSCHVFVRSRCALFPLILSNTPIPGGPIPRTLGIHLTFMPPLLVYCPIIAPHLINI